MSLEHKSCTFRVGLDCALDALFTIVLFTIVMMIVFLCLPIGTLLLFHYQLDICHHNGTYLVLLEITTTSAPHYHDILGYIEEFSYEFWMNSGLGGLFTLHSQLFYLKIQSE